MMRRDARTDDNQTCIVDALRQIGTRVLSLAQLGKGAPDLLCYRPPIGFVLLEVKDGAKSPSRQALTPDQIAFHRDWPVIVVNSVDSAVRAVTGQKL